MRRTVATLAIAAVVLIAACAGTVDEPPVVGEPPPPGAIQLLPETITTGQEHSCGVTERNTAYCWGYNGVGELGDGTTTQRLTPTPVAGGLTFTQVSVSAGGRHTCGLTTAGEAYCWGWNTFGQLGDGTTTTAAQIVPKVVSGGLSFTQISAGKEHTCALSATGAAYCWGSNYSGQLGDGTFVVHKTPTAITGGLVFQQISAGGTHTCGVTTSGEAYCWGNHIDGQVGDGTDSWDGRVSNINNPRPIPTAVAGDLTFAQVSAGWEHTCGVTTTGEAYCWGSNIGRQLGDGTQQRKVAPSAVVGGRTYSQISAGRSHTCGVTTSGTASCWGYNYYGQLGEGWYTDHVPQSVPVSTLGDVVGGLTYSQVRAGGNHTCGVTPSGEAYCWGRGREGQLGTPFYDYRAQATPVQVKPPQLVLAKISAGGAHTCALAPSGEAFCWGDNHVGQLGDGTWRWTTASARVVDVWGGRTFQEIASGGQHSCGLTGSGEAYCWGSNTYGQLGDGTTTTRGYPALVPGGHTFSLIGAGARHTCALTAAGQAYCWGDYGAGAYVSPQPIGLLEFTQLSARDRFTCALREETAYCWGLNDYGQLGFYYPREQPFPAPVSGELTFSETSAGARHACAVTTGGETYCWGLNNHGQLGDGTTTQQYEPTPIAGSFAFTRIAGGGDHTCALTGVGAAHCWGRNDFGQLGDGTTTGALAPTTVTGGLAFTQITGGDDHTCALTGAGTAQCWGRNDLGQLGDGTTTHWGVPRSSAELDFRP